MGGLGTRRCGDVAIGARLKLQCQAEAASRLAGEKSQARGDALGAQDSDIVGFVPKSRACWPLLGVLWRSELGDMGLCKAEQHAKMHLAQKVEAGSHPEL